VSIPPAQKTTGFRTWMNVVFYCGILRKNPELGDSFCSPRTFDFLFARKLVGDHERAKRVEWLRGLDIFRTRDYYNAIMDLYRELRMISIDFA
jgi:hypothetical protein